MPELPEVETIRRELEGLIIGKTFARPQLHIPTTIAFPEPGSFSAKLEGRSVSALERRGKYLLIRLDRLILVVHLRMTGNLVYSTEQKPEEARFLRVSLPFTDRTALFYSDMRRFGRLWLVKNEVELKEQVLKKVGPDIYNDLDAKAFAVLLKSKGNRRLKALLLDQEFAAGMGNIYTDECLYRCCFHPLRRVDSLSEEEKKQLFQAIRDVLDEGIKYGGTSFRDYRNAAGALGQFQQKLNVYNRQGEYCSRCGAEIEKTVVAGRGTYFCPGCQAAEEAETVQERKPGKS